jgi:hypothetical protein
LTRCWASSVVRTDVGGVEAFHEAAERWDSRVRQDGSLGRTELLLAAALNYRLGATQLGLSARAPVWRHIVIGDGPPGTLSSPVIVSLSALTFSEARSESEAHRQASLTFLRA